MSHLIFADEGNELLLNGFATYLNGEPCVFHLYSNDYTPTRSDTVADYTEATVTGYAAEDVDSFGGATDLGGNVWQIQGDEITWTLDGSVTPQTLYGYYVTDQAGAQLLWAERFDTAEVVDSAAYVIPVLPTLTSRSLYAA